jgi:hypothetical protein
MEASEIKTKIEKINAMSGLSDAAKKDMVAAWQKKLDEADKEKPGDKERTIENQKNYGNYSQSKSEHLAIAKKLRRNAGLQNNINWANAYEAVAIKHEAAALKHKDEPTNKQDIKQHKTALPRKKKNDITYKGKLITELDEKDCEDLLRETKERRANAAKSEKKSKSRPIMEKVSAPIVKAVIKAIDNIPAADLKDAPKKELSKIDKAIALTKAFLNDLKGILGEDWDKDVVIDELQDLIHFSKELHKKYGK